MTPEEYIQRLTENSEKKLKLLKELLLLTQNQTNAIQNENVENLNKLIDAKQSRLDEIDKIDEEFNVYFLRLKQFLKIKTLDEIKDQSIKGVKELQMVVSNVINIIKEISDLDGQNQTKANDVLKNWKNEIQLMNLGKKTDRAYNPPPVGQPPSYFIDKKK